MRAGGGEGMEREEGGTWEREKENMGQREAGMQRQEGERQRQRHTDREIDREERERWGGRQAFYGPQVSVATGKT